MTARRKKKPVSDGPKPGQAHVPTQANRDLVRLYAALGKSIESMARSLGIGDNTVRKYYSQEIATGHDQAEAMVGQTALYQAIGGKPGALNKAEQPDWRKAKPEMTKYWLDRRAKWTEKVQMEVTGAEGAPLFPDVTDEQRARALAAFLAKQRILEAQKK